MGDGAAVDGGPGLRLQGDQLEGARGKGQDVPASTCMPTHTNCDTGVRLHLPNNRLLAFFDFYIVFQY